MKKHTELKCSACKKIIKVGVLFTVEEKKGANGEKIITAQYCKNCKK